MPNQQHVAGLQFPVAQGRMVGSEQVWIGLTGLDQIESLAGEGPPSRGGVGSGYSHGGNTRIISLEEDFPSKSPTIVGEQNFLFCVPFDAIVRPTQETRQIIELGSTAVKVASIGRLQQRRQEVGECVRHIRIVQHPGFGVGPSTVGLGQVVELSPRQSTTKFGIQTERKAGQ